MDLFKKSFLQNQNWTFGERRINFTLKSIGLNHIIVSTMYLITTQTITIMVFSWSATTTKFTLRQVLRPLTGKWRL